MWEQNTEGEDLINFTEVSTSSNAREGGPTQDPREKWVMAKEAGWGYSPIDEKPLFTEVNQQFLASLGLEKRGLALPFGQEVEPEEEIRLRDYNSYHRIGKLPPK